MSGYSSRNLIALFVLGASIALTTGASALFRATLVTPDGGSMSMDAQDLGEIATFKVKNTGGSAISYTFTCSVDETHVTACVVSGTNPRSVNASDSTDVNVILESGNGGMGSVSLQASGGGENDSGSFNVDVQGTPSAPNVLPDGGTHSLSDTIAKDTVTFQVSNTGTDTASYSLSCTPGSGSGTVITNCVVLDDGTVNAQTTKNVDVEFSTVQAGEGTLTLTASGHGGQNSGTIDVTVNGTAGDPRVTPKGGEASTFSGITDTVVFSVENLGVGPGGYSVSGCSTQGAATFCDPLVSSVSIGGGQSESVEVEFTSSQTGAGTVALTMILQGFPSRSDSGWINVQVGSFDGAPDVRPDGVEVVAVPDQTDNLLTFSVTNGDTLAHTYTLECLTDGTRADNCRLATAADTLLTITPNQTNQGTVDVDVLYDAGSAGTPNGHVTLRASIVEESVTFADDGSYVIIIPEAGPPVIDLSPLSQDRIDRPSCVTVGAGPEGAFQCGELLLTHSMPSYRTLGRDRTLTLLYNSSTASPYPVIAAHVALPDTVAVPDQVEAELVVGTDTILRLFDGADFERGGDPRRIGIDVHADSLELGTGVHAFTLNVSNSYGGNVCAGCSTSVSGDFIVVDRQGSAYGAGWHVAGVERVHPGQPGNALLLEQGDGSAAAYDLVTTNFWRAPPGAFRDTIEFKSVSLAGAHYLRTDGSEGATLSGGSHTGLMGHDKMTWAFWIQSLGNSGKVGGITTGSDPNRVWWFEADNVGAEVRLVLFNEDDGNPVFINAPGLDNGDWNFVTAVFDGSQSTSADRIKIYIDGVPKTLSFAGAPVPDSIASSTSAPFEWGELSAHSPGFDGLLGELAILDVALDSATIEGWRTGGIDFGHSDLVAGYRWANDLTDESSNGNDLTNSGLESEDFNTTALYPTATAPAGPSGDFYVRRLKSQTEIFYDTLGYQRWVRDRVGHLVEYIYPDTAGGAFRLEKIRIAPHEQNKVYEFAYDCSGACRLTSVTDPAQRVMSVDISSANREVRWFQDPGMSSSERIDITYTGPRLLNTWSSRMGHTYTYTFESPRPYLSEIEGPTVQAGQPVTEFVSVQMQGIGDPSGAVATSADIDSAWVSVNGPRAVRDTTRFLVNKYGAPTEVIDGLGNATEITYGDSFNPLLPTRMATPDGRVVKMTYDARGNLTQESDSTHSKGTPSVVSYAYHPLWNRVTSIDRPAGGDQTFTYDTVTGDRLTDVDAAGNTTTFRYEGIAGMVTRILEPAAPSVDSMMIEYDDLGRIVELTNQRGSVWSVYPDAVGRPDSVIDPLGQKKRFEYTELNLQTVDETTHANEADTVTLTRFWNGDIELDSIADPVGRTTRYRYDADGALVRKLDPAGAADSLVYDLGGNRTEWHTRRGHRIDNTYDDLGRLVQTDLPAVADTVALPGGSYGYIQPADQLDFEYDVMGRLTLASDDDSEVVREYNPEGTIRTETQKIETIEVQNEFLEYLWEYRYDLANRVDSIHHPEDLDTDELSDPLWSTISYDATRGLVATLTNPRDETWSYFFDARARLDSLAYPNGAAGVYAYYPDNTLKENLHPTPAQSLELVRDTIIRDTVGNVTRRGTLLGDFTAAYDGFYRLTFFEGAGPAEQFSYNEAGDRSQYWITPDECETTPILLCREYLYDAAGRLDTIRAFSGGGWGFHLEQTWHDDGALQMRAGIVDRVQYPIECAGTASCPLNSTVQTNTGYFYDARGRLVRLRVVQPGTGTWTNEMRYDALGRRIVVWTNINDAVNDLIQRYVYNGDDLAYSTTASHPNPDLDTPTQLTLDPVSGQAIGSREVNGPIKFIHRDDLGSIAQVSLSGGGIDTLQIVQPVYAPFGEPGGGASAFYRGNDSFTGAPTAPEGAAPSLVYLRNRYYDPNTGRFTQEDPIGFAGGVNLYAYAGSNPTTFTDPFGLCPPIWKCLGDFGASLTPGVSTAHDFAVVTSGRNLVTGQQEGLGGRLAAAAGLFTLAGGGQIRAAGKAISAAGHFVQQAITRGVKPDAILDALRNPLKVGDVRVDDLGRPSQKIVGPDATVIQNPETGKLITTYPTSSRVRDRLTRERESGGE